MRIAWFQGDAQVPHWTAIATPPYFSQDELNAAAEQEGPVTPRLRVLLVRDDVDLRTLGGDDWNDAPADCNASEPYRIPEGSEWVELRLGDPWPVYVREP